MFLCQCSHPTFTVGKDRERRASYSFGATSENHKIFVTGKSAAINNVYLPFIFRSFKNVFFYFRFSFKTYMFLDQNSIRPVKAHDFFLYSILNFIIRAINLCVLKFARFDIFLVGHSVSTKNVRMAKQSKPTNRSNDF